MVSRGKEQALVSETDRAHVRLAEGIGLDEQQRAVVYYTALLINVGCHSDAHEQAKWFGDDISIKAIKYDHEPRSLAMSFAGSRRGRASRPATARGPAGLDRIQREARGLDYARRGLSNKQHRPNSLVHSSPRPSPNHVEHIYLDDRWTQRCAAAGLFAMQHGLLPEEAFSQRGAQPACSSSSAASVSQQHRPVGGEQRPFDRAVVGELRGLLRLEHLQLRSANRSTG